MSNPLNFQDVADAKFQATANLNNDISLMIETFEIASGLHVTSVALKQPPDSTKKFIVVTTRLPCPTQLKQKLKRK